MHRRVRHEFRRRPGFDVTYELDGAQKVVRMDHDPGKRIPVEDGELVVTLR